MNIVRCYKCMREFDLEIDDICPHCGYYQREQFDNPDLKKALFPGSVLHGKYYVGCVLGIGGFAITYSAYNLANHSRVAIKEYFPSYWASRETDGKTVHCGFGDNAEQFKKGLEQFYKESHQLARVGNHRDIVNVFEVFTENETAYIVMEFVDGISLEEFLKENGPMEYTSLLKILVPICFSLEKIHTYEKVIHRDIAPDNIILQPTGRGKLIDFGASTQVTQINENLILKHGYAPPEQYNLSDFCDATTDIYAMSAVLYHMLTGKRPPKSVDRLETIQNGEKDPLISPIETGVDIPDELNKLIRQGLELDRSSRPQNMGDFAKSLSHYLPESSVSEVHFVEKNHKKAVRLILAIGIPLIVLAVIIASVVFSTPKKRTESVEKAPSVVNLSEAEAEKTINEWMNQINELRELSNLAPIEVHIIVADEYVITDDRSYEKKKIIAAQVPVPDMPINIDSSTELIEFQLTRFKYEKDSEKPEDYLVEIPNLSNLEKDKAVSKLKKLKKQFGLKYEIVESYNETTAKGKVYDQSIKPVKTTYGAIKGKKIMVYISKGSMPTTVPTTHAATTRSRSSFSGSTTRSSSSGSSSTNGSGNSGQSQRSTTQRREIQGWTDSAANSNGWN